MNSRIFISSTCYDLIDLRAELKEFIESLGLIPVLSDQLNTEFTTYNNENSIATCLINLRNCEVVIVILSQRYGPSLKKNGFEDYSATHLEYREAVKHGIKTIVFVRDRLRADYDTFKKTNDVKSLSWIPENKEHNRRLFEIIGAHDLENKDKNNWLWNFKDSIELKNRLKIDLKSEIQSQRLAELIKSGNVALLETRIRAISWMPNSNDLMIRMSLSNVGTQSAIEPKIILHRAANIEGIKNTQINQSEFYQNNKVGIDSLRLGESSTERTFTLRGTSDDRLLPKINIVVEILYRTIHGDLISDLTEISAGKANMESFLYETRYKGKQYRSGTVYETILQQLNI